MPVVMCLSWSGVTPAQYDAVRSVVDWEGVLPVGGVHHTAWFDDAGLRAIDVWESAEAFEAFVGGRLMPGVAQVGIAGEPEVVIAPAHADTVSGDAYASLRNSAANGVTMCLSWAGWTPERYDRASAIVGQHEDAPAGMIHHTAWFDGEGIRVFDVWASADAFQAYVDRRLMPGIAQIDGVEGEPEIVVTSAHSDFVLSP